MKKEAIIIVFIVLVVIISDCVLQKVTVDKFDVIQSHLENLREQISSVDEENIENTVLLDSIYKMKQDWENEFKILAFFVEHDELEKIGTQIALIKAGIEVKDFDTVIEEIDKCDFIIGHIRDKDSFQLVNIF